MDPVLKAKLNLTVLWSRFNHTDGAGEAAYDKAVTLYCYVEGATQMVLNAAGREVLSNHTLYIDGTIANLSVKDYVVLSSGLTPTILNIYEAFDSQGNRDHWEVFL